MTGTARGGRAAAAAAAFLVAVSVGVSWCMSTQAVEKQYWESLDSMCDERARMLQDQFNASMNHLQALAILISTFHRSETPSTVDKMTFARYAKRTAFERPLMSGVAYAVRVTHAEREMFERQQGWSIKKMYSSSNKAGNAEVREPMEEYAPVVFAQDGYKHVVSFDMLSGKEDRENILRARESGKAVLTAPFKLLNNRLGVISTHTVYKTELPPNARPQERIQAAIGYLGGIFDIEALVDKLLHQLAGNKSIVVNIYDTTNDDSPVRMYGSNDTGSGMCHVSTLNFGDPSRKHEMHCRFMQKQPPWAWLATKSSVVTLVIASLIGYMVHAASKRTAKVEDDYRELKRRAEDAAVAKSQLLATVSHKIRTQMNGVLGMLQMLMDTDLVTTQQDYVRTAQASAKAPFSLINEVLEMVPFDLRTVCDDILSLFCWKAQEKGLELAVYVSTQVPETLIGDPGRIRQIITNLVGNSIKFTERGHVYLTVHLVEDFMHCLEVETGAQNANTISGYPVAKKCSWEYFQLSNMKRNSSDVPFAPVGSDSVSLIISVEDTGVGIPFEAQSRVFTPFMQAGPSIARINGGTGIGLSINRCLIGLMKGEIKFASKPEVGSTFTFTAVLTRACSRGNENKSSEFKEINALVFDHRLVRAEVTKYHLQRLGVQTELTTDLDRYISKVNCGLQIAKVVFIDKETWLKESHSMPHLLSKLRSKAQTYPPKLFLLENPTSSVKGSSHVSREYNLNVIMKPLRASLLQVSLRRALGWDADEGHFRNGGVGNSTVDCLLFRNIVDCLLHKKQIIVVDDDIVSLKLAAAALKKYGAEVTCVDSGKKAVTLLQPPHSFDGCFMDIHMPEMDGFEATSRIRAMERDLNERIGRGELPPECASVGQWRTPILAMTADVSPLIHEACLKSEMDGYVSKPFEGGKLYSEYARFVQTNKNPSSLELSNIVNHQILEKLEQDEFVSQERLLNLHLEVQEKLEEAERKLEELRMRSKFITMVIKKLTSVIYLQKKVVLSVILLGLMLYSLLVITGAFDFPFHQSLRITMAGQNMMVNDFGWSHGKVPYSRLDGTWANETVSVDLNTTAGNNDSSGQQQHWYSHYSIKYQEETGEMQKQNRTVKPHLPAHMSHKTTVGPWIWIALVSLTMLVLGIAIAVWLLLWCIRRKRAQQNELELFGGLGHRRFQLYELAAATSNFRDDNKIGQGGFGPVYKGYLRNQDCLVAIKVLTKTQFEQGLKEFKAEVKVMTQLRHRNIVKLFGWCNSKKRLLLVYELMAQGSLDKHLYDPEKILTWQQRYKIVLDLGAGLLYLHQDCEKCVVHGDIKPANVMLDVSYNAKLGDFGLARLIEHEDQPQTTQNIAGTPGYIDPEFLNNRWPRTELDVYSFGVVLLEIACGKRPASSLLAWVRDLYDRGLILDAADQRLNGEFDQQQMERVLVTGLWCALQDPMPRPSILQAMDVLRCARAELPVLPAAHDARRIRSMEEQAYGDLLPVEDRSVHALAPSRYFTSKDSVYLLAEE